jgi:peptidoglycan/xylan/chitin deacetylase (PgdA/CDA1 family)
MHTKSTTLLKTTLSLLHATGLAGLLSPLTRGAGAILMLHQVSPGEPAEFEPNRILRITPEFLDQTIRQVLESGFDVLSLDEVASRLASGKSGRPFVVFTLDDAYKDNLVYAYPVFKKYGLPFTVYAPTDYIDGKGELWWLGLEQSLAAMPSAKIEMDGVKRVFPLTTAQEKTVAYDKIYWWLRSIDETVARQKVRELCVEAGICLNALCRELIMDWNELRQLAADPLVTIGGHTRRHYAIGRLGPGAARAEIVEGVNRLEKELSRPVRHFSFPFGDETSAGPRDIAIARDLGFSTAVTTRKGVIRPEHKDALHALPRLSLNGDYQHARYVEVLLSGLPFRLRDFVRGLSPKPTVGV